MNAQETYQAIRRLREDIARVSSSHHLSECDRERIFQAGDHLDRIEEPEDPRQSSLPLPGRVVAGRGLES